MKQQGYHLFQLDWRRRRKWMQWQFWRNQATNVPGHHPCDGGSTTYASACPLFWYQRGILLPWTPQKPSDTSRKSEVLFNSPLKTIGHCIWLCNRGRSLLQGVPHVVRCPRLARSRVKFHCPHSPFDLLLGESARRGVGRGGLWVLWSILSCCLPQPCMWSISPSIPCGWVHCCSTSCSKYIRMEYSEPAKCI